MSSMKCPVCGNPGVPNYYNEDVICPNCNSDLSIYKTLHSIAGAKKNNSNKVRRYKILSIVLPLAAVLLIGIIASVYSNRKISNFSQELAQAKATVAELRDSISSLSAQYDSSAPTSKRAEDSYIEYTILQNDSPWGIIRKFYGNRNDWEVISRKLAEANELWDEASSSWKQIHPGQVIKIYNIK